MKFERVNTLFDWLLWLSAIAVGFCTLFGAATITYGDGGFTVTEGGYSSGAAFRVTYDNPWFPPKPPKGPKTSGPPELRMRTASWCVKCPGIKKAIQESRRFKLVEISAEDDASVPSFSWDTPAGPMGLPGWWGMDHLTAEWQRTTGQKMVATTAPRTVAELRAFASTYNGPMTDMKGKPKRADYRSHLIEHGYAAWQVNGLSQSECAKIHGATHAGLMTPMKVLQ